MKNKYVGASLFVILFAAYMLIPVPAAYDGKEFKSLVFLALCMVCWFTEFIPLGASAILILALPSVMGVATLRETLAPFPNPILFFSIAAFALSAALYKVPLAKRLLLFLFKIAGGDIKKIILAVMSASFLISSIMSNIPATAMFIPICLSLLDIYDDEQKRRQTGRTIMVGLSLAGMIGGVITPAGSSNNLVSLSILEESAGMTVSFVNWFFICAPIAIVTLPVAWIILVRVFKPAEIDKSKVDEYITNLESIPAVSGKEIAVAVIMLSMIVFWVLSSWFPDINPNVVAIVGMAIMFLPGIEIFTWKEFSEEVSWAVILMVGSVLCVGNIILQSGITVWLDGIFISSHAGISPVLLILQVAILIFVMQLIIPNGPAVIASTTPLAIAAAQTAGINPAMLTIPLCILASWTIILPLSAVPMVTYSTGYYKISDIGRVGLPVLIIAALIMSAWVPFMTRAIL